MKKDIKSYKKKDDDFQEDPEQLELQQQELQLQQEKIKQKQIEAKLEQKDKMIKNASIIAHAQIHKMQQIVQDQFIKQIEKTQRKKEKSLREGDIESAFMQEIEQAKIVHNASLIFQELQNNEIEIIKFRLSKQKTIICKFCGETGQSIVEESTSVLTWLFIAIFIIITWDRAQGYAYIFVLTCIIIPCIAGVFKIETHSCRNCLNEVKQQSIFSYLDLEDEIVQFKYQNFALVIKRRTLFYSLLIILAFIISEFVVKTKFWLVFTDQNFYLVEQNPLINKELSWLKFNHDFSRKASPELSQTMNLFYQEYHNKFIEWEGQVLRVQVYDEQNNLDFNHLNLENSAGNQEANLESSDIHRESILYQRPYYCQIYMKMTPKYTPFMHYKSTIGYNWPDLIIFFDFAYFQINSEIIDQLKFGDTIRFKAKVDRLRNKISEDKVNEQTIIEDNLPHLKGLNITIIQRNQENLNIDQQNVQAVLNQRGRYNKHNK